MVAQTLKSSQINSKQTDRYLNIVKEIESRGIMPETAPSLFPMQRALERILSPSQLQSENTILVAGTNGKGSVCVTLESLLLATGETVGLYTSPHLEQTTERFKINGKEISQDLFCHAYLKISDQTRDLRLTHFEVLTAMAAWLFLSGEIIPAVKYPIFEVGLGGRWDATNAIPHHNCIITSLGYDHQNLLGNTLEEIASNKFGIIGPGARVVYSPFPSEAKDSLLQLSDTLRKQTKSQWTESAPFDFFATDASPRSSDIWSEPQFSIQTPWGSAHLSLAGKRAAQNTATALTFFAQLGYDPKDYLHVLQHIHWPGRMERIANAEPCPTYLSGDHNSQGAESLIELLNYYKRKHLYILAGVGKDKDLDGILSPLFSLKDTSVFLTETPFKGRVIEDYGKWRTLASGLSKDPNAIFKKIQSIANPDGMIVITGSLYLVGFLRPRIQAI